MIVPSTEIVHDRANLEVFRGCIRGCRFCQAGFSCRPVRKKSPEVLYRQAVETLRASGNNEITISSLSTSDYRGLKELTDKLIPYCTENKVSLSVPSLRADNFSRDLMERLQAGGRKSSLTFAPEAGTQRLRDVINKNLTEDEILTTCANAFSGGWNNVKLYFMLGLPTETDEDVLGIAELVYKVILTWKEHAVNKKRGLRVHVATAYFVPKPHTPFQWEKADHASGISAPLPSAEIPFLFQVHRIRLSRAGFEPAGSGLCPWRPPAGRGDRGSRENGAHAGWLG